MFILSQYIEVERKEQQNMETLVQGRQIVNGKPSVEYTTQLMPDGTTKKTVIKPKEQFF